MAPENDSRSITVKNQRVPLFKELGVGGRSLQEAVYLSKEIMPGEEGKSEQGVNIGQRQHPFDFDILKLLKDHNEHHSTCIHAKTSATVGLGFLNEAEKQQRTQPPPPPPQSPQSGEPPQEDDPEGDNPPQPTPQPVITPIYQKSKADEILDPLTSISWHDTLMDACEDFWDTGNGYIEVVRRGGEIKGLHYIPSREVRISVDDSRHNFHYVITGEGNAHDRHFAAFGDKEDFLERLGQGLSVTGASINTNDPDSVSEVIHFRRPSSRSKWYGTPDWVSAVPMIELCQMLHQYKFDFFNNRGVPEFMLFITGGKVADDDWKVIEEAVKANIGFGNSHKSTAVNIPMKDITVQVEKLAMENSADEDFKMLKETVALSIVTAHKVPPLLAGIQIPGKLGATNELSQALIAFQSLVVGQAQRLFQATLARTLGGEDGVGLDAEDFTFKTITDDLDPKKMDMIGRMHQPLPQANAEGRDLNNGLRD